MDNDWQERVDEALRRIEEECEKGWSFRYALGLAGCASQNGKIYLLLKEDARFIALKDKYHYHADNSSSGVKLTKLAYNFKNRSLMK